MNTRPTSATSVMQRRALPRRLLISALALAMLISVALPAVDATEIQTYAFEKVWWRTDLPVATNRVNRTWVWGPAPISSLLLEPYDEGQVSGTSGVRWVQYFDKTRVEITHTGRDTSDPWYVTNGLLASELITGRMRLGDQRVVEHAPAEFVVAGDSNDPNAPTYRSLNAVLGAPPREPGAVVTERLDRHGNVTVDDAMGIHNVWAERHVPETNRTVASVFWSFMTSEGLIYDGFDYKTAPLFNDPFFATGFPITDPYWMSVHLAGEPADVLVQAFERRVLTYTPGNPDGWKVEAANIGRHYYQWRYQTPDGQPLAASDVAMTRDLSGNWMFMGDVHNKSRAAYGDVEVRVELLDNDGVTISSHSSFIDASLIEAGGRFPFQVWTDSSAPFASYQIDVRARPAHRSERPPMELTAHAGEWATGIRYDVGGTVRYEGERAVVMPQYIVALYDESGNVVAYQWGMIDPTRLAAGEAAFETFFLDPPAFSEYRIFLTD